MTPRTQAELFLVVCALIWGATFVIVKMGLGDVSPFMLVALRFGLASAILVPFCFSRLVQIPRSAVLKGGILGILLFGGFAAQTLGLKYTSASKSGFITGLAVVFTPIFQLIIERRPPRSGNVMGVVLVTAGLYLLTSPEGSRFNRGDLLTLGCALAFALHIVYLDIFSKVHETSQLTFMQISMTGLLGAAAAFLFETRYLRLTTQFILSLVYLAVLATLIALYLQMRHQKQTTPTRAAVIFSLEPVFAATFAYLMAGESLHPVGVFGGTLIVAGLIVSELSDVLFPNPKVGTGG